MTFNERYLRKHKNKNKICHNYLIHQLRLAWTMELLEQCFNDNTDKNISGKMYKMNTINLKKITPRFQYFQTSHLL